MPHLQKPFHIFINVHTISKSIKTYSIKTLIYIHYLQNNVDMAENGHTISTLEKQPFTRKKKKHVKKCTARKKRHS